MAGRNQHFIPQFHQRSFGVKTRGKPKEIWVYRRNDDPELVLIKDNAADHDFYSNPDDPALDDQITEIETPLSRLVAKLRGQRAGTVVTAAEALEVILHLAPRTDHMRSTLSKAMGALLGGVQTALLDPQNVKRLLGLHTGGPSQMFTDAISRKLESDPWLLQVGLPAPVLEKIAFQIARESFDEAFGSTFATMGPIVEELVAATQSNAREAHTSALQKFLSTGIQRERLLTWTWTVEDAPLGGLVLPDCVALGRHADGSTHAFMLAGNADLDAAFMPLSTGKVLVGRPVDAPMPDLTGLNRVSAECSSCFFAAHADIEDWSDLRALVGTRAHSVIDDVMESILEEYVLPEPNPVFPEVKVVETTEPASRTPLRYEVSFLGCADQPTAETIAACLNVITDRVQEWLPLDHLEGVTFAADYAAAVAGVDRGREDLRPAQTVDPSIGVGYAKVVPIVRDGALKARLVLADHIGYALMSEDEMPRGWAIHVIVRQLAYIGLQQVYDETLPGFMLQPMEGLAGYLYSATNGALGGYLSSRWAAGYGSDADNRALLEDLVLDSLERATTQIKPFRFAYRYHGDLDRFLSEILPLVGDVVERTAQLIGHCDGLDQVAFLPDAKLTERFRDLQLERWLGDFRRDLNGFWEGVGSWSSIDDLFVYNRHVERVLWQFGVFPWSDGDGNGRVEIPLASDALELLAAEGLTAPVPASD